MTAPTRGFTLDQFQLDAIAALDNGSSVLVSAPTGSGKTVVAEAGIAMALASGGKAFYTTPIKALSNQKFADLSQQFGPANVGLLTGDHVVNPTADVLVMTTEVLRNMMYARSSTLVGLHLVVLDEVHYLQDSYRGAVWEEVIIGLDQNVRLVCLSATVSNADELGEWISTVRGPTVTIVETERPVELTQLLAISDRHSGHDHLIPIELNGAPNPHGSDFDADPRAPKWQHGRRSPKRYSTPRRLETIERLAEEDLLPTLYFIFSRDGCDDALALARDARLRLNTAAEARQVREIVERCVGEIADADLDALDFDLWCSALEQGIAAHHAGMVPAFKQATEQCFIAGLIKVVFATETLALGVNMPARSVVIEKLMKYNGDGHELLNASQYTQITGRAGRRGIDEIGAAVVLWSPLVPFAQLAHLAMSRNFPLLSSFRTNYNMAANIVRRYDEDRALDLLGQSFAQFQADRSIVGHQRRLRTLRARQERLTELAHCSHGDVVEYARLSKAAAQHRSAPGVASTIVAQSLQLLRPGEIIALPDQESPRFGVVISVAFRGKGVLRIKVIDADSNLVNLGEAEFDEPVRVAGEIALPTPYAPNNEAFIQHVANDLKIAQISLTRPAQTTPRRGSQAEQDCTSHPVHSCPDREAHVEAQGQLEKLNKELERSDRELHKRTGSVVQRFRGVANVLGELGFLDGWSLTEQGERLAQIYHECDLVLALGMQDRLFDGLDQASLAALVACITYEERRPDSAPVPSFPTAVIAKRFARLAKICSSVQRLERQRGLPQTRDLAGGFAAGTFAWANGAELVGLIDGRMSGGDFVRNTRLVVDLLSQIATVAPDLTTRATARKAAETLRRGVVTPEAATLAEVVTGSVQGANTASENTAPENTAPENTAPETRENSESTPW